MNRAFLILAMAIAAILIGIEIPGRPLTFLAGAIAWTAFLSNVAGVSLLVASRRRKCEAVLAVAMFAQLVSLAFLGTSLITCRLYLCLDETSGMVGYGIAPRLIFGKEGQNTRVIQQYFPHRRRAWFVAEAKDVARDGSDYRLASIVFSPSFSDVVARIPEHDRKAAIGSFTDVDNWLRFHQQAVLVDAAARLNDAEFSMWWSENRGNISSSSAWQGASQLNASVTQIARTRDRTSRVWGIPGLCFAAERMWNLNHHGQRP